MQLNLLGSTVKKIIGHGINLYHFTEAGVDIHRMVDGERLAWAELANVTCGAVNGNGIYLGTSAAGVYLLPHAAVESGGDRSGDLVQRFTASSVPPLGSSSINRMAGRGAGLLVTTAVGAIWMPDSADSRVVDPGTLRPTWRQQVDSGGCGAAAINAAGSVWALGSNGPGGLKTIVPATALHAASRSAMGADLTGSSKWFGAVLGGNGKIYCVPYDATDILIIDPVAGTASRSAMGADLTGTTKWIGAVLGGDGKIYCVPYAATDILIIDPVAGTASRSAMGADLTGTAKWVGAVLGGDGKIYCPPANATDILIIDPVAGTASRSAMGADLTGSSKWFGAVLGGNGKIYCPPHDATDILIIDPVGGTASRSAMGATLTGTAKWIGAVLGGDGKIYSPPRDATDILIIDPVAGTASRSAMGASLTGTAKWDGAVLGGDGRIYSMPRDATDILIIDPVAGTASRSAMGATLTGSSKFFFGALASNGTIYGAPRNSETILIVAPPPPPILMAPDILSDTIRDLAYGGTDLFIATDAGISIWDGSTATNITTPLATVLDVQSIHPTSTASKNSGLLAYGTSDGEGGGRFGVLDLSEV